MNFIKETLRVVYDYVVFALFVFMVGILGRPLIESFLLGWHIWD